MTISFQDLATQPIRLILERITQGEEAEKPGESLSISELFKDFERFQRFSDYYLCEPSEEYDVWNSGDPVKDLESFRDNRYQYPRAWMEPDHPWTPRGIYPSMEDGRLEPYHY